MLLVQSQSRIGMFMFHNIYLVPVGGNCGSGNFISLAVVSCVTARYLVTD